jgi:hypothetical protein
MIDNHLTDDQLQDFLDGNLSESDPQGRHLEICPHCQRALAHYKSLYSALATESEVSLSADFTQNILRRIAAESQTSAIESKASVPALDQKRSSVPVAGDIASSRFKIREGILLFAAIGVLTAITFWFTDPSILFRPLLDWMGVAKSADSQWLAQIRAFLKASQISPLLIVVSALTIIAIGGIDFVVSRLKNRHPLMFFV